ncbi:hypothetical protein [Desertibaculum subflavum]|uniref:hypothetical protein n=1 Tax=Desertibaculum subflavum TaxID=2268458 RepID=UPI000E661E07
MRRTGLTLLTSAALLSLAACASGGDAETRARDRCLQGGAKPNTPELQQCIRDTESWMEQNRRLQQRIYTQ